MSGAFCVGDGEGVGVDAAVAAGVIVASGDGEVDGSSPSAKAVSGIMSNSIINISIKQIRFISPTP